MAKKKVARARSASARPRSAGPKITNADLDQAASCIDQAISKTGKLAAGFKKAGGFFRRRVAKRQYSAFLKSGGKAGDWQSFIQWLIENLPAIIKMIMEIFHPAMILIAALLPAFAFALTRAA